MTLPSSKGSAQGPSVETPSTTQEPPPIEQLTEALSALVRGEAADLDGLLHDVETHAVVGQTKITTHCHCLKLDAHGRPKVHHLVRFIAEQVTAYVIPRSTIRQAGDDFLKSNSPARFNRLHNEAIQLFTTLDKSGEGGVSSLTAIRVNLDSWPTA